ncbi:MAG: rRNA (uracil1939-C5)-methyltransferase [Acidobacteriota bacterium]|jgi:23S rRNA (uracil1939-C5)-methyltransferase|nr:rRNA (uracil1939-C5)-methyltransferase [Acidobacteriota bacterium]
MKKRKGARPVDQRQPQGEQNAGAIVEVTIERILPGGAGLAHADGRTLLVALAAPGDRAVVRIERMQGRVAFASIVEIISPSPVRVEPPCPYFGRCGGCDFQQLSYEAQLQAKVEIIRDCLHRIAHLEFAGDIPVTGSPNIWHYRSRAQWQHDPLRKRLGYFERASHRVCDVVHCPVLVPELEATLESLREQMKEGLLPEEVTELQAVAGDDGASLAPPVPEHPTREVCRRIGEDNYCFSAEGFFQINHELLESLIAAALGDARGQTAIDLYCGAGLFTLPLARRFTNVFGVEANATAIGYARRNLEGAQLAGATFEITRVGDWLTENSERLAPIDFVLLDPPRAGAETEVIDGILALKPRRISYVSCDPATLARDLKGLTAGGYRLDSLAAFDMFPQTHHVETVAHLRAESYPH